MDPVSERYSFVPHQGVPDAHFKRIFESSPAPQLILGPDLRIVAVSESYLRATMRRREEIFGKNMFDAFPDNPDDPKASGVRNLRASLERVLKYRRADAMPVQKYDIPRPAEKGGGFEERYWSPLNAPVLEEDGSVAYIVHQVEDVTEFVLLKDRWTENTRRGEKSSAEAEALRAGQVKQFMTVQEDERRRIARELHDQMGQLLTALSLKLKSLEKMVILDNVREELRSLEELANRISRETHSLALQLRPTALDDLGLDAAIRNFTQWCSEQLKLRIDYESVGLTKGSLPPLIETAIFRIVQEALTNVAKHAKASSVSVVIELSPSFVNAIIEDNGVGFEVSERLKSSRAYVDHFGLIGMRERIAAVGGTLEIESLPKGGTTLFARIPLTTPKSSEALS